MDADPVADKDGDQTVEKEPVAEASEDAAAAEEEAAAEPSQHEDESEDAAAGGALDAAAAAAGEDQAPAGAATALASAEGQDQPEGQPGGAQQPQQGQEDQTEAGAAAAAALTWGERPGSSRPASTGTGSVTSRPASALRELRGSRPNSAAIAAQIEGFDADFLAPGSTAGAAWDVATLEDVPEEGHATEAGPEPQDEEGAAGPGPEEQLQLAAQEHQHLMDVNEQLQRRVRAVLDHRNRGRPTLSKDLSRLDGAEARYRSALKQWTELREDRAGAEASYGARIFDAKAGLEGRIKRAEDISATFHHFRREVALAAEFSKTGRPLPERQLAQLEAQDAALEEEVQRVRLKNIHLSSTLSKLEASIRAKEELAEGLHLIDFEQLKIENQSLNEKIEERNEELMKLRKKLTSTVQVLTHMKEKLQFVERENGSLTAQLSDVDGQVAQQRGALAQLKAQRDRLRSKQRTIKDASLYITNPQLLKDMQKQREVCSDLQMELELLHLQGATLATGSSGGC